jgi:hypothetical protein
MLNPDERSQLQTAISAIERRASGVLSQAEDSGQVVAFISTLHRNTDAVITTSESTGPTPECKSGCTYCCHVRVEVSDPEALYIAWHVQHLPPASKVPLIERLHLKAGEFDGAGRAEADISKSQPCAFLQDGLCSIYSIHPSVCRKAHRCPSKPAKLRRARFPRTLPVSCSAKHSWRECGRGLVSGQTVTSRFDQMANHQRSLTRKNSTNDVSLGVSCRPLG